MKAVQSGYRHSVENKVLGKQNVHREVVPRKAGFSCGGSLLNSVYIDMYLVVLSSSLCSTVPETVREC